MRPILPIAALLLLLLSCISAGNGAPTPATDNEADTLAIEQTPVADTLTLLFAGDMMQHAPQYKAALTRSGVYDYSGCFDEVKAEIESADIAIANLETTLGASGYSGYPCFCSPDAYAQAIQDAGFDVLMTANNHSVDRGARGIARTIEVLDTLGMTHFGTYVDSTARAAQYPLMLEAKGMRIAMLCYTYGTNGIPVPQPRIVNLLDTTLMANDIARAQSMQPDAIIAMVHWGIEYQMVPNSKQTKMAQWLLDKGVTHVIGGHPHVIQPIELRTDTLTGMQHLVAYSLGNYVSHQLRENTCGGMMARLQLTRDTLGRCVVAGADYSLIWVDRPAATPQRRVHRVLPVTYADSLLNAQQRQQRDIFARNARAIFAKHNKGIEEKR